MSFRLAKGFTDSEIPTPINADVRRPTLDKSRYCGPNKKSIDLFVTVNRENL